MIDPVLYVDVKAFIPGELVDAVELRSRLEVLHERVKGRRRDYVNQRTKDRYRERARGVELALAELDKLISAAAVPE
jgi:hypothetical protein